MLKSDSGRLFSIPLNSVSDFERSLGKVKGNTWAGAGIGFLIGAVSGVVLAVAHSGDEGGAGPYILLGAGVIGIPCGLIGALIGASTRSERWEPVPLPIRVGIPSRHRSGSGLSALFEF